MSELPSQDTPDAVAPSQATEPAAKRRPSRAGRVAAMAVWLGVGMAALLLAVAYLYPQDLRETSRIRFAFNCAAFAGEVLQAHIGLACLAATVAGVLLRRWRLAAVSVLLAVVALLPTGLTFLPKEPPAASGSTLRIHSMNLYKRNQDAAAILAEVDRVRADVLVLQEWHDWHEANLTPQLSERFPYQTRFADDSVRGMAILSRRPILENSEPGVLPSMGDWGVLAQRVVVEHEGRPVAIYNVHTASPGGLRLLSWNQYQTLDLMNIFRSEPLPLIAAGDFNAATFTDQLAAVRSAGVAEVHAMAGHGPGWTWPRSRAGDFKYQVAAWLPGLRIDHIFLSRDLAATSAEVGRHHGGDHLGVFADVGRRDQGGGR